MRARTHRFTVRGKLVSLNHERKIHHMARAEAVKQWRTDAFFEAKAAHLPHLEKVSIIGSPFQHGNRLGDAGNHLPALKAAIDGLVDAGVLDGDGPDHVTALTMMAPQRTTSSPTDCMVIELIPAAS
jgi:hypothetical protein